MIVFRKTSSAALDQVFRGHLAAGVAAGATSLELEEGEGDLLPAMSPGETMILRLGQDSGFRPVIVTGRTGDVLDCEPLADEWGIGTPVVAAVMAEILAAMVQREELGSAALLEVGVTAGTVAAGNSPAQAVAAHEMAFDHDRLAQSQIVKYGAAWSAGSALVVPLSDVVAYVSAAGTIVGAVILSQGGPGSCQIDVRRAALADPPDSGDSMCGSSYPAIASGHTAHITSFSGWDTALEAGDVLSFAVLSSTGFKSISIIILVKQ